MIKVEEDFFVVSYDCLQIVFDAKNLIFAAEIVAKTVKVYEDEINEIALKTNLEM